MTDPFCSQCDVTHDAADCPHREALAPRPAPRLPESLNPSARYGGGDPLADYLHQKGEGR